ncbi:MAG: tryptophan synthase subunit alpha [Gammaproteobacteria bacterium]
MKIKHCFTAAKQSGKKLFIPYITCGDPDLSTTEELIKSLVSIGADMIELGVPFSDPLADGVTNQMSAERALKKRVSLSDCIALVKKLRHDSCEIPIILFSYFNPILNLGIEHFASQAEDAGIDGVLVVDLPIEEAEEFNAVLAAKNLSSIFLISPTTCLDRINKSAHMTTGFLYYVSRTGTTGTQACLSATLNDELKALRSSTDLPIAVGFGISTPTQAASVSQFADAVIVGSALVKILENTNVSEAKQQFIQTAKEFAVAIKNV